ncbi:MAG: protein DpdG [Candidatus Competibacteraceae bacterium]
MSVITSFPVVPNRLHLLLRQLARSPTGLLRDKLMEEMNPPSLAKGKKTNIFTSVLGEAMRLGLVVETSTEKGEKSLQLAPGIQNLDNEGFIRLMEQRLLQYPGEESWDRGRFPEALTWLLMQDPLRPLVWDNNVRFTVENDLGEESEAFELTNKSRFQNLVYWARFLGYAVKLGFSATELSDEADVDEDESQAVDSNVAKVTAYVLPDPTTAIARHLPTIFRAESQLSVSEFLKAWAPLLPVLEGGAIRKMLEQLARPELVRQVQTFSRATSLALWRLAQRRVIELRPLSDAEMYVLDYERNKNRVSHIVYLGQPE